METHRFNFVRADADQALAELDRAFDAALRAYPATRFLTPVELAEAMMQRAEHLIEARFKLRMRAWLARIRILPRFWKLARLSGLAMPLWLLGKVA